MCCRYTQIAPLKGLAKRFGAAAGALELTPRWNLAPSQEAPVVLRDKPGKTLALLRWGLIPSWAKDPAIAHKLFNARAESADDKPAFSRPFKTRRCLVPADGFYEWRKDKTPFLIRRADQGLFAFAGLWDAWEDPRGKEHRTFTILTTDASPAVKPVHARMPVILEAGTEDYWLDPKADLGTLKELLVPYAALTARPVSPLVNSPNHDSSECAKPVPLAQPELW